MRASDTADLWWKNAVVYCLDVQTYFDGDGDGQGDLRGLAQRIDHIADLGATVLWLMPFYPTADVDDGYDITDFYGVDPRLGTLGDFVEVVRTATDRGLKVIADLVVNHTSAEHPWFQSARSSRDSPYRDWYVWRDDPPPTKPSDIVFPDREDSIWTYDEEAGQHYLHRFYRQQPDLNVANPAVREEIAKIMGFWMELGLHGFRVDAVPFLIETSGIEDGPAQLPDPHDYLRDLPHQDARAFFGDEDGDELTLLFDFPTMQAIYLALARGEAGPVRASLMGRPTTPDDSQWAMFVRNHDELTLDKLSGAERAEVFAAFGPEEDMQLFGRGLRRRLPPMLDGDQRRIRLVYSLMMALPGTPTLFYGEEIGLGEQLALEGRLAVRTPMQWQPGPLGGFSTVADPKELVRPFPDAPYGPDQVNVQDQRHDPESLLSWMTTRIRRYRECPEVAWGAASVLEHPVPSVLVHRCDWEERSLVLVHNLADRDEVVPLELLQDPEGTELVDLFDPALRLALGEGGRVDVPIGPYGSRWLRLVREGDLTLL